MPGRIACATLTERRIPNAIATSTADLFLQFPLNGQPRPGHDWDVSGITADVRLAPSAAIQPVSFAVIFGPNTLNLGAITPPLVTSLDIAQAVTLTYNSGFTMTWSDTLTLQLTGGRMAAPGLLEMSVNLRILGTIQ